MTKAKGRRPIRTASPTLRRIFEVAAAQDVSVSQLAKMIGKHENSVSLYRSGRAEPGIFVVEEMASALGLEIRMEGGESDE